MNEYIKAFIKLAKEKMQKRPLIQSEPYEIFEEFTNNALKDIKQSLKQLTLRSPSFYYILFDEWLTGRRAFEGEQVAHYLLSPWGFEDIRTEKQTKKLADEYLPQVKADMRAKARNFLGKEMAVRIDFKADKYYKKKLADFYKKLKVGDEVSTRVPYLNEEDEEEINSEEESIQNLAKEMAKSLVIEI
jgi:gas vesicle protein